LYRKNDRKKELNKDILPPFMSRIEVARTPKIICATLAATLAADGYNPPFNVDLTKVNLLDTGAQSVPKKFLKVFGCVILLALSRIIWTP
jgi:hypothetical protein